MSKATVQSAEPRIRVFPWLDEAGTFLLVWITADFSTEELERLASMTESGTRMLVRLAEVKPR